MQYDPIKKSLGIFFNKSVVLRKVFYALLNLLLLRTWHVKRALKKISSGFPDGAKVLDAGSGFGQYTWLMSRSYRKWRIKAIDIKQEQIEDCKAFFSKTGKSGTVNFERADLTDFDETANYNIVLSVDVMEHIEDDLKVFRNFFNALARKGILLISTPSDKGGSDVRNDQDESFIEEHVRDGYNISDIRIKLEKTGFGNISTRYTYGFYGQLSWLLSMKIPVRLLNMSYWFFVILPFYYLIIFPVSLILNIIDLYSNNTTGTGLLIVAEKI
jgi:SAM-dependent methyltransferase